jgi:hypothetical protein
MSEDIRKMIDKVKNFKQFVNENIITDDDYDDFFSDNFEETEFNYHKSRKELYEQVKEFMDEMNNLNNPIKLYRIIQAKNSSDININNLGIHCKLNDNFSKQFLRDINIEIEDIINGKYNLYVVVVSIDKKYIDVSNTIKNNIKYPDEEEVTIYENSKYNVEDVYEYLDL